ncbi:30S ribosomal protein S17 [Kiritimatiellota bacterium B12222]|nr:30S ribosomal protein S17 [Kiritimatiellota bacterium B12222]
MSENASVHHVRKSRTGTVVSSKMNKTIVVSVERRKAHKLYGKIIKLSKKYYVHDENCEAQEGDFVRILETRPISKMKSWRLAEVVRKSADNTVEPIA